MPGYIAMVYKIPLPLAKVLSAGAYRYFYQLLTFLQI